jgi:phenylalanyl-tRNA synthetase beta chain
VKFTLSWLKDHLQTSASLDEICERLTMIGLEVEHVDTKTALKPFKIVKILNAIRHPDAGKLQILTVDTGTAPPIQVVCGAHNAKAGMIGVMGSPGDYVPGLDVTLTIGKIRGQDSYGMMCSEEELQLPHSTDGIIELPHDAPIGQSFASYAGLDDPVIDINLTPNRPDCTSIYGIARDLAASSLGVLKTTPSATITPAYDCPILVDVQAADKCQGFAWRMVRGVKNTASPAWLQQRLTSIGLRPINALVDITNYITFDRGRPLHVFDAQKIKGSLIVRCAIDGEEMIGLDGRTHKLNAEHCVISDDNCVVSISGIMGSEHTGCDENTTEVIIESALWSPIQIAKTGRTLNIISDARYRFERGVDPEFMADGLDLATQMVLDICGGAASTAHINAYQPTLPKIIDFPVSEVKRLTGIDIAHDNALDILKALGFGVEGKTIVSVSIPSWRPDVDCKADLVEEVMRIYGVDNIVPQPLPRFETMNKQILNPLQIRTRLSKRTLAARGMMEALTWSFISESHAKAFGGGQPTLKLANPIAADMSDMRPSLLPGLIVAAQRNADKGISDVALFEVSGIYENDTPNGQRLVASGVRRGSSGGRSWERNSKNVSVYDAKADALAVLEACGASLSMSIEAGAPAYFHPGRSGVIKLGPKVILGYFGEFHPNTLEILGANGSFSGFEVFIDAISKPKSRKVCTKPMLELSSFQPLKRDFAFIVLKTIQASVLVKAAQGVDKKLITQVQVFDVFEGTSLGADKKSIGIEVTFQPFSQSLNEEELANLSARIITEVSKASGGVLRS